MAYVWTEAMTTGVTELDNQHKELFRQVNNLSDAMRQGLGRAKLQETLEFFMNYTLGHFKREEDCMNSHRCPSATANKLAHAQILQVLTKKKQELASREVTSVDVIELQKLLGDWLIKHIGAIDINLARCVKNQAA